MLKQQKKQELLKRKNERSRDTQATRFIGRDPRITDNGPI